MSCPRDGSEVPERPPSKIVVTPPSVPGYRLESQLGEGGFSHVWNARRDSDRVLLAAKIGHASTEVARSRFALEADALTAIGAPHVPKLHERGVVADGRPYFVMDRLELPTLAEILAHRVDPPEVAWLHSICDAVLVSLHAVHEAALIHRDLKPENIFIDEKLPVRAILTDFGIAQKERRDETEDSTVEHTIIGTAEYMAPEQLAGERDIDLRVDIYAFGVLLYELLTLRVPFTGDLASIEKGHRALRPPPPRDFVKVPAALEALCLACLAKDASRRPRDVPTLRKQLAEACRDVASAPIVAHDVATGPVRLLQVSRQPIVLLAAEVKALDRRIAKLVTRRKGFVAKQQGLLMLAGFSGLYDEKPEQAALTAAQELVEHFDARVVVHFDELTMRASGSRRPPRLYGQSVSQPTAWLPSGDYSGVLLTQAMAELLPEEHARPSPKHPGFHRPVAVAEDKVEGRLVGRDDDMALAEKALRACLSTASPGLLTVIGGNGLGKSRVARAIGESARAVDAEAEVYHLRSTRRAVGRATETFRRLRELVSRFPEVELQVREASDSEVVELAEDLHLVAARRPLIIVIDDAHYADDKTLDAIEYATANGRDIRLFIAVCAHPRLHRRRPRWGERAHAHDTFELQPLAESDAMEMAAELLRPAEFPPRAVLLRLAQWTAGNPQSLDQLVRTLKRQGVVRQRSDGASWYVATAELDQLPASPVGQWLGQRQLDALPMEQAACVRVCAVLGQEFSRDELAWVQSAAERDRTATTTLDTDVGLDSLYQAGIIALVRDDIWAFAKASFQDAIYKLVASRDRESIHRQALAFWQAQASDSDDDRVWASIARHAGSCGAGSIAADAYLELGNRALRAHKHVEADVFYTAALPFIDADDHERLAHALGRRGAVRYRTQRIQESLDDLQNAREQARQVVDRELLPDLMLEEATALDWAARFAESATRVIEARELLEGSCSDRLEARFLMSEGRSAYRANHSEEAVDKLERAIVAAIKVGDSETRIISLSLLATLLAFIGRYEDSEARFAELIELCEQALDRFHLCVAFVNRSLLWMETRSFARLRADLEHAIQLAREIGQPALEWGGAHNLAEYLFRSADWQQALVVARRSYGLQRFLGERLASDSLRLASILICTDQLDEARALIEEARHLAASGEPSHSEAVQLQMLELVVNDADEDQEARWATVIQASRIRLESQQMSIANYLEVIFMRGLSAVHKREWDTVADMNAESRRLLPECPIWEKAFSILAGRATDAQQP